MPMHNPSGAAKERELATRLHEKGYAVMRAPASGAGTMREMPDVLAIGDAGTFAIEAKKRKEPYVRMPADEIQNLHNFAFRADATPVVAVRPNRKPWRFVALGELNETEKGYSVLREIYYQAPTEIEQVDRQSAIADFERNGGDGGG